MSLKKFFEQKKTFRKFGFENFGLKKVSKISVKLHAHTHTQLPDAFSVCMCEKLYSRAFPFSSTSKSAIVIVNVGHVVFLLFAVLFLESKISGQNSWVILPGLPDFHWGQNKKNTQKCISVGQKRMASFQ